MNNFFPLYFILYLTFIVPVFSDAKSSDFDNPIELAKIMDQALIGEWDDFTNKSLPFNEFRQKKGLQYLRTSNYPYSGYYVQLDKTSKLRNLRHFIDGILDGPTVSWRENGLKFHQGSYKEGKKNGILTQWSQKKVKILEQNFKDGKLDGLSVRWYRNGQKSSEQIFQDGHIVTAIGWKPDGERCPSTRVVDGVGVLVIYDDFGEETIREEFEGDRQNRSIERYTNGNIREEGYYLNSQKDGLWIYYRPDGKEHFRITYRAGEKGKTEFSTPALSN